MSIWTELLPADIRSHDIDGVRTRVLRLGPAEGVPLLLLHGRGGHLETFVRNAGALAAAGSRVIAFDLLGHGLTAQAGDRYDIGELLAHARAVRERFAPRAHDLIGQSLGGWIAVLLARERAPRSLALVEPAGLQSEEDRMADPRVRSASVEGGRAFDDATEENVARRFAQLLHDPAAIDPEMVAVRTRMYALPGAGAVHRAVRTADNRRWLLDRGAVTTAGAPVLVLRGEHGHIPAALLEDAVAGSGGRVVTIPGARQWPHYENPAAANAAFLHHLKERTA